jgi:hypothetical protein
MSGSVTDHPPGACEGGPVYKVHTSEEECSECRRCGVVLPADVADGPFLGWAAWCEKGVR